MGKELLDDLIQGPVRSAAHDGVPGTETHKFVEELHKMFKDITYDPRPRKRSRTRQSRLTRVEEMRRIYLLCKTPDSEVPPLPALTESVHSAERGELWESEVDKLVEWTHSLSLEELDRL
ncbi:hypothetical protein KOW79_006049 [Hemibagrus wyckioides]|uniref:Uncharacterized protein n=1 Tax=Hemibagrus wyckioides TaxID=337641 RepID=A0A9D3SMQ4_9TELE|nr:hypothetical protein KOW79_006049 [Hemibagrus wyckioides]